LNSSKKALTVIPRIRKGSRRSQTIGYNIKASNATGQQITNKISQRRNLTNSTLLLFFREAKVPDAAYI